MRQVLIVLGLYSLSCNCTVVLAQDNAELLARMKAMEERIQALEAELRTLKGQPPAPTAPAVAPQVSAAPPAGALPRYGGASAGSNIFNPDMAVIGTFVAAAGSGGLRPTPSIEMSEAEVALQAIVDPFARADFFLSFGERGVNLEEGYLTFTSLPGGLQAKAGKMRAAFGKVNTLHSHALPWIDRPLVTRNLLAGEEGISDAGLALSRILPAPGQVFLEATAQVYRGDTEELFQARRRSDVGAVGHLRGYRDISESTNVDLGVSYARGHSPLGPGLVNQLYGLDATLRWKPLRRSIYRSFIGRTELVWGRARQLNETSKPFGYYATGEYQLGRRWFLGGRFDRSDRLNEPQLRDTGGSILLTYRPSEFSRVRGQLRRTRYGEQVTANEFLFQLQYSIGAHAAHPF